jgi:DNA-binding transcriptional LysR family regulator
MVTACSAVELTALLAGFSRAHPAVEIVLSEATSAQLVEQLRDGRLDLAWVALSGLAPAGIDSRTLVDEPYVAAVRPEHDLAGRPAVRVEELQDVPLACLPPGSGQRSAIEQTCAAAGFAPRVTFEGSSLETLAELAAAGLGVAVLPESVAKAHSPRLQAVPLADAGLRGRVEIAWRAEGPSSPAGRALVAHARTAVG